MPLPVLQLDAPALAATNTCVHCGLCLPACPTYRELGQEMDSPRGRIVLARALHDGRIDDDAEVRRHFDRCLDCRACETACPSGVDYGSILASAREGLSRRSLVRRFFLGTVLPSPRWLAAMAALLRLAQVTDLDRVARLFPRLLADLAAALPRIRRPPSRRALGAAPGANAQLHLGCVMDVLFPDTNLATARLLERAGYAVQAPPGQVCCGSLHRDTGDLDGARAQARANLAAFEATRGPIVTNAAGCGSQLKRYPLLFEAGSPDRARAEAFSARVLDLSEALVRGNLPTPEPFPHRVAYQDACHLAHGQRVRSEPRALLRAIPGLELIELPDDACCGSAGIYNLTEPALSARILAAKLDGIAAARPEILVTPNPGCYLQLTAGSARTGGPEVVQLADFLDRRFAPG